MFDKLDELNNPGKDNLLNSQLYDLFNELQLEYSKKNTHEFRDVRHEIALDKKINKWLMIQKELFQNQFKRICDELNASCSFYFGCPLENYEKTYSGRLEFFQSEYRDVDEEDFIKSEIALLEEYLRLVHPNKYKSVEWTTHEIVNENYISIILDLIGKRQFYYSTTAKIRFLKEKLEKSLDQENEELVWQKKVIIEKIEGIDNEKGWSYVFRTEDDYNMFVNILTEYFTENKYTLPDKPINLKRNCKTRLGKTLGEIHYEISEKELKTDHQFHVIVRKLSHFENEKDLYKVFHR
jgi:hypothetical protein